MLSSHRLCRHSLPASRILLPKDGNAAVVSTVRCISATMSRPSCAKAIPVKPQSRRGSGVLVVGLFALQHFRSGRQCYCTPSPRSPRLTGRTHHAGDHSINTATTHPSPQRLPGAGAKADCIGSAAQRAQPLISLGCSPTALFSILVHGDYGH